MSVSISYLNSPDIIIFDILNQILGAAHEAVPWNLLGTLKSEEYS